MTVIDYHGSRFSKDTRRNVLWETLWRYFFSNIVDKQDCVLDLGSGYGSFINTVRARRRIAVDAWDRFPEFLEPGIEFQVGNVSDLDFIDDGSVDFAFASNLFEHLNQPDFALVLEALRRKLSPTGTLTILQPNCRYAYREYFDDFDHKTVYSHVSLADYLTANGYDVFEIQPRFMPLSVKSSLPVWPFLIRAWLMSPFKPGGKQMLVRARPRRG